MAQSNLDIRRFKGVNLRESPGYIQDEELQVCENFNTGRTGELIKRTGFTLIHDGSELEGDVILLGFYRFNVNQIIVSADNGLFSSTDGGSWEEISDSVQGNFGVQYDNKFWIISDDGIRSWDGSSLSALISDSPGGTYGIEYRDRLFVLGNSSEPSRLYYSAIGDFEDWPSTGFLDVTPGEGDRLTVAAILQDILMVFKSRTVYSLNVQGPPANWVLRTVNRETGCISNRGFKEINDFLFFIGPRGVWRTDGYEFDEISKDIDPIFAGRVVNQDTINLDSTAEWENKFILLLHPQSTVNNFRYLVFNLETGGWTEWVTARGIHPSSFLDIDSPDLGRRLFAGDLAGTGRVYRYGENVFTDAGEPYLARFKSKQFDFSLPSVMKRGKWGGIDIQASSDVSFQYEIDEHQDQGRTVEVGSGRRLYKVPGPGYFRTWAFAVEQQAPTSFNFYSYSMWLHSKTGVIKAKT